MPRPSNSEGNRQLRARFRERLHSYVDHCSNRTCQPPDAPLTGRVEFHEFRRVGPVGETYASRRMAAISNLGSAGTLHVTADNTLLPFGESAGVGRIGKELFGRAVDLVADHNRGHLPTRGNEIRVARQVKGPTATTIDTVAERFPAWPVAFEMAVLEFEACPFRGLGDKSDLDLARIALVCFELPLRTDVPTEHDPIGGFVGEDPGPSALGPIGGTVVDVAADLRLESRFGDVGAEQVVLWRLEFTEAIDKSGKGISDGCVHHDLAADNGVSGHGPSSLSVIVRRGPRSRSVLDPKRCPADRAKQESPPH